MSGIARRRDGAIRSFIPAVVRDEALAMRWGLVYVGRLAERIVRHLPVPRPTPPDLLSWLLGLGALCTVLVAAPLTLAATAGALAGLSASRDAVGLGSRPRLVASLTCAGVVGGIAIPFAIVLASALVVPLYIGVAVIIGLRAWPAWQGYVRRTRTTSLQLDRAAGSPPEPTVAVDSSVRQLDA